jgi:hypothetical protein
LQFVVFEPDSVQQRNTPFSPLNATFLPAGDAFSIPCPNRKEEVEELLEAMGLLAVAGA